jgi:hypothetical protein
MYVIVCVCEIFCDPCECGTNYTYIIFIHEQILHVDTHIAIYGVFFVWYEQMVQISVIYSDAVVRLLRHIYYYIAYSFKFINVINHVVNP